MELSAEREAVSAPQFRMVPLFQPTRPPMYMVAPVKPRAFIRTPDTAQLSTVPLLAPASAPA